MGRADGDSHAPIMRKAADAIEELNCNYQLALGSMKKEHKRAEEAKKPRWISATERLPEPYKEVLFCGKSVYGGVQISYGYCEHTLNSFIKWVDMTDNEIPFDPTHWMPLPSAPELPEETE